MDNSSGLEIRWSQLFYVFILKIFKSGFLYKIVSLQEISLITRLILFFFFIFLSATLILVWQEVFFVCIFFNILKKQILTRWNFVNKKRQKFYWLKSVTNFAKEKEIEMQLIAKFLFIYFFVFLFFFYRIFNGQKVANAIIFLKEKCFFFFRLHSDIIWNLPWCIAIFCLFCMSCRF